MMNDWDAYFVGNLDFAEIFASVVDECEFDGDHWSRVEMNGTSVTVQDLHTTSARYARYQLDGSRCYVSRWSQLFHNQNNQNKQSKKTFSVPEFQRPYSDYWALKMFLDSSASPEWLNYLKL